MTSRNIMGVSTSCESVANFKYSLMILTYRSHVQEENAEEVKLGESLLQLILKSLCLLVSCHKA
jgi:hypothetical protein